MRDSEEEKSMEISALTEIQEFDSKKMNKVKMLLIIFYKTLS